MFQWGSPPQVLLYINMPLAGQGATGSHISLIIILPSNVMGNNEYVACLVGRSAASAAYK